MLPRQGLHMSLGIKITRQAGNLRPLGKYLAFRPPSQPCLVPPCPHISPRFVRRKHISNLIFYGFILFLYWLAVPLWIVSPRTCTSIGALALPPTWTHVGDRPHCGASLSLVHEQALLHGTAVLRPEVATSLVICHGNPLRGMLVPSFKALFTRHSRGLGDLTTNRASRRWPQKNCCANLTGGPTSRHPGSI